MAGPVGNADDTDSVGDIDSTGNTGTTSDIDNTGNTGKFAIASAPATVAEPPAELVSTPHGDARLRLFSVDNPRAVLAIGHGAGGGTHAPDITAVTAVALEHQISVVLVDQPYRVAGRRAPAPARQLDAAWVAVMSHLNARVPLICAGRSSGARVACRTASEIGAAAVLCLAFPLLPPSKAGDPSKSRLAELARVHVPVLVVQGRSDPFGVPEPAANRHVATVAGNHALRSDLPGLQEAVATWLQQLPLGRMHPR
ncbi:MAG: alpha/beta family hydrolase [Beutenbergiaceae bacterium]